jgi:hypothetical protein
MVEHFVVFLAALQPAQQLEITICMKRNNMH